MVVEVEEILHVSVLIDRILYPLKVPVTFIDLFTKLEHELSIVMLIKTVVLKQSMISSPTKM